MGIKSKSGLPFQGHTICLEPEEFTEMKDISLLKTTLESLKANGEEEWFQNSIRGRRKGEELQWITTRYDIQAGTKVEGAIPHDLRWHVNPEDIKTKLRELAAAGRGVKVEE